MYITLSSLTLLFLLYSQFQSTFCYIDIDREHTLTLGSHNYRLNTPPGIHDVFHTRLLRPASSDPLSGQVISEPQPLALSVDGEAEYEVEAILDQKTGRGGKQKYLVKWKGYLEPTWEPYSFVKDLSALDTWEANQEEEGDSVKG